jgi:hypothetical protein
VSFGQNPQQLNKGVRIMFYNVENLFHPTNDSLKNDDEFTKEGMRYWTFNRYYDKLNKIGKTVMALGEWEPPAVIGLCEVENIECLTDLVKNSPLKAFGYEIVFKDCDDTRGIDVALLYRPQFFNFVSFESIKLNFPEANSSPSRDILYTKGHCWRGHFARFCKPLAIAVWRFNGHFTEAEFCSSSAPCQI